MTIHVIYHAGCADGFGAAWTAWRSLGDQDVHYHPASYGNTPVRMAPGSRVYILDFSYPRETMLDLAAQHEVTLLDHHETAMADIGDLPGCAFDTSTCGAVMAWRHFSEPGSEMPEILGYIEDRDLWRWELEDSREVSAALESMPRGFQEWEEKFGGTRVYGKITIRMMAVQGEGILRGNQRLLDRIAANTVMRTVGGHTAPVVNTPVLVSEACERLLEMYPSAPFAAAWYETGEGRTRWSLRSRAPDGMDVSLVAKQLGGGGHPHAAGFTGRPWARRTRFEGGDMNAGRKNLPGRDDLELNMGKSTANDQGGGNGLPGRDLPQEAVEIYRNLVRGDRTFPAEPPNWVDDMMAGNWGELDQMLEEYLADHPEEAGPGTPSEALRDYINRMDPPEDGE